MSERSIFLSALDIADPAQRAAFLDQACGDDSELRQHFDELIAAEAKLGGFLARPHAAVAVTADEAPAEHPGTQIGPYKLLQVIGEGGMGVVYMAEQDQPIRRRVALKIIKPGMDSKQVIARFEAERQALAMMDHQNIARVLDAGTTQSGRPYFVMELVHGVPMTKFCDDSRLTPRERLELFVPVCQAIQHAHQKGVIHRDIKPSNILVTMYDDKPVPKVIDFGVAKAIEQRLTEKTLFTQYGTLVGTFEYMSPEQAEMNAYGVDTRSDIYSLGVLLYELLTGTTPLDRPRLREAALVELVRMIKEDEPQRPSIRLSSTSTLPKFAAACRTEPARLSQLVRGELDWIVMKCLEKDRTRRYETASNLARDVQRYLQDEPVEACPPSLSYRISKFTRRYKAPLTVAAGFVMLLIVGVAASTWQAVRATNAEAKALANGEKALQAAEAAQHAKEAEADQRRLAEASEQTAVRERNSTLAAKEELRHTLYASEMNLVQAAWESRDYTRVAHLLEQQQPATGQTDLRGFEWHYWQRQLHHGRLRSLAIPQLALTQNATLLYRDGTRLATVVPHPDDALNPARFGLLTIFDCATGRELFPPFDPFPDQQDVRDRGRSLSASKDGTRLAIAFRVLNTTVNPKVNYTENAQISIRDGGTGSEIHRIESQGLVSQISLAPDGRRLAVAYSELSDSRVMGVKVWDTSTGELFQTLPMLPTRSGAFNRILWSPDNARLLRQTVSSEKVNDIPGYNQLFQVVDAASGEVLWERNLKCSRTDVLRAWGWSPDGKLLVVAQPVSAAKPAVQLWDSITGTTLAILDLEDQPPVNDATIDFSRDGQLLAFVSQANEIKVWDVPQFAISADAPTQHVATPHLTLHNAREDIQGLAFSADGRELSAFAGTSVVTWDATARTITELGPDKYSNLLPSNAINSATTKIAFSAMREGNCVWDLAKNESVCELSPEEGLLNSPVFSPDGRRLALVMTNRLREGFQIVIHDPQTGEQVNVMQEDNTDSSASLFGIYIFFRPDGRQIAALRRPVSRDAAGQALPRLMAWDVSTQKQLFSVSIDATDLGLSGYSPDGASLIVGVNGQGVGTVFFYDAITGVQQKSIQVPSHSSQSFWVDIPGQFITAEVGPDVVLYDLTTGQERLRLSGHNGINRFASTLDGSRLALAKNPVSFRGESELTLWSLKSGRRLLTLKHPGHTDAISFSPDGNRLVGVFRNLTLGKPIRIWDATPLPEEVTKPTTELTR